VSREEGLEVLLSSNGAHSRATASVRNGKGLVQVQVAHISPNEAGRGEAHLGVEVGAVHVDLAPVGVDDFAHLDDVVLEDSVGGGVGDEEGGELVLVELGLGGEVVEVDVALVVAVDDDDLHAAESSGGGVGAVGGGGDEAHVALVVASALVVALDGHQASELAV